MKHIASIAIDLSLNKLFAKLYGKAPPTTTDDRFLGWTSGERNQRAESFAVFDADRQQRFQTQFAEYKSRFHSAQRMDGIVNNTPQSVEPITEATADRR